MKKTILTILRWLHYMFIGVVLLLVLFLALLHTSSTIFDRHHEFVEQFISKTMSRPVTIKHISLSSRGLEPIVKLHNLIIFDKDGTTKLISADRLDFGIDLLGSLFSWQIRSNFLSVGGSEVSIAQDSDGKFKVVGFVQSENKFSENDFNRFLIWLLTYGKIDLRNFSLKIGLLNGKTFSFKKINLKIHNGILQHHIISSGSFLKIDGSHGRFISDLKLYGDMLATDKNLSIVGNLSLDGCVANLDEWGKVIFGSNHTFPITDGKINLSLINSKITHQLFRQPFLINALKGIINWQHRKNGLVINVDEIKFADQWLEAMGRGSVSYLEDASSPTVNIRLKYNLVNLNKAKLYYPATLLPVNGLLWLDQAFVNSRKISGEMILEGDLAKFPFDNGEGKFLVSSKIQDVVLNYDPQWPKIEGITGSMIFDRRSMDIRARRGKIMGSDINYVRATIANLEQPILQIEGEIHSNSKAGLLFVNASPLRDSVGRNLKNISIIGSMLFKLKFTMPLASDLEDQETKIDGLINLRDNRLVVKDWSITAERCGGNLIFTQNSLQSENFSAVLFGRSTPIIVSTLNAGKKDSVTRVIVEGVVNLQNLEQSLRGKLQPYLEGGGSYKLIMDLSNTTSENIFKISSDLMGIMVKLPPPFSKEAHQLTDFILSAHFYGSGYFKVFANYGNRCAIALKLNRDLQRDNKIELATGALKFGEGSVLLPAGGGLYITGSLPDIDGDQWCSLLFEKGSATNLVTKLMLREISLRIGKFKLFGKTFEKLTLSGRAKSNGLELAVGTNSIKGKLFFPKSSTQLMAIQPISGVFEKLYLENNDAVELGSITPERWPPLNLQINNFSYGKERFSRLMLVTFPVAKGLEIRELNIENSDFAIRSSGEWIYKNGIHESSLQGRFSTENIGTLLLKRHQVDNIAEGNCTVDFNLHWPNMPHRPEIKKFTGVCSMAASHGRIVNLNRSTETKLGFSRILNLLSLQSLPRRLTLDFSDLSKQGLVFDSIIGNFELSGGNIVMKRLKLIGPAASVNASGRIGLVAEDYDLILGISPKITSSIPVAATIAGGPIAGAIGFVAEKIISSTIKHIDIYKYRITGFWSKPQLNSGI